MKMNYIKYEGHVISFILVIAIFIAGALLCFADGLVIIETVGGGNVTAENFSTWTIVNNDAGVITYTGAGNETAVFTNIRKSTNSIDNYMYNDRGAGNIGDFTYRFEFTINNMDNSGYVYLWGVSNDVESAVDWTNGVLFGSYTSGGGVHGAEIVNYNGTQEDYFQPITMNQDYFCTAAKASGSITVKCYNDDGNRTAETNELFSLAPITDGNTYRYLYIISSKSNNDGNIYADGNVTNVYIDAE